MTTNKNSRFDIWADLDKDVLVGIFMTLNVVELIRGVSVCKSWLEAASEPCLWKTIDLSKLEVKNFNQQREQSSQRVMDIVNSSFSLSGGTISCFIFHFYAYITSQHLAIGQHCKNLRELKMMHRFDMNCAENILAYAPSLKVISLRCNRVHRDASLKVAGFEAALKNWPQLESLTIPCDFLVEIMEVIGKHCNKSAEMKLMCDFYEEYAEAVAAYIPNLKVLSLRCAEVSRGAVLHILNQMNHLQVLNLSHSYIVDHAPTPNRHIYSSTP
ncbi:F-box/LRR-repeat protein At3g48880 [Rosa chinensis]|uniref:F-box/LRR-repeat protein At3g48880 n=1 Tax=Rosa chinensis TaxID=74649 RepID=UPI000D08E01D|nr:F-box/LRR-repeat protein At3g48880 [Rosa chinensis]